MAIKQRKRSFIFQDVRKCGIFTGFAEFEVSYDVDVLFVSVEFKRRRCAVVVLIGFVAERRPTHH